MCLEGIDDEVRILFDQVNDGAYVASNSFWENDLYVVTPELTPHRKSTLENLMAQQFDKFKQSYN
jgi:hypothetical protein